MKENWTYKKLGEIANVSAGQSAPQGDKNYCLDGTPFIKAGNLENLINGKNENEVQKVSDEVALSHRLKKYKKGSVLFAKSGMSCMKGWVYTLKNDCYVVSHLAIVTPKRINSSFLNYYFKVNKPNKLVKDSAYPSISLKDIENFQVPIPPMEEQERIVAELDLLQSVIDKKKAQLDEYDKLAQSIFYEMFGDPIDNPKKWEVKKMGKIGECISGGTPSRKRTDYFSGNINWFSAGELNSLFLTDSVEKITQEALDSSAAKLCKPMSLFIGMYDTAAFKLGIPTIESTSNQACANVSLYQDNIIWLYYVLLLMKDEALKHRHGARQKNLNLNYIKNFEIPLPPLSLQQSFAEKIEAIEHQKELVKQSLSEVKTLFDSRMDYYFN